MHTLQPVLGYLLLVGLAFFFGLAFEDFYARDGLTRPGGVRTFPLLALCGGILYQCEPEHLIAVSAGLLVLGAWLTAYYLHHIRQPDDTGNPNVGTMVAVCNLLAYLLGPAALSQPPWVAIGATVIAVMFLTQRSGLHKFAQRLDISEVITAGKFLALTGLVLPLLPDRPVTRFTDITPHQVWLAVIAVSTVSYASYLLQRYALPRRATMLVGLLGGLYSSTVTTVVLARRAHIQPAEAAHATTGIILATAVMYLRLLIVVALFNESLAVRLAPPMVSLALLGFALAGGWYWWRGRGAVAETGAEPPGNPLDLVAALTFAFAFVVMSVATTWVHDKFGAAGTYALAAVIGVTDIDPFVLNLAQTAPADLAARVATGAILIATSSNNILKAGYAVSIAGRRAGLAPLIALGTLAIVGLGMALMLARG